MFRAELAEPVHREEGFTDFFEQDVIPLLRQQRKQNGRKARFVAHHVIAPALSPGDKEAFKQVRSGDLDASKVIGPPYTRRIKAAKSLGCITTRLQIAPGSRLSTPPNGEFLKWQKDIGEHVHKSTGEGFHVAWWNEQQAHLAEVLGGGAGLRLQEEFKNGFEEDFPVGGSWTIYGDTPMEHPLLVAGVMYRKDGPEEIVFEGFNVFRPEQLTPETNTYLKFWRDVHISSRASMTIYEARNFS